MLKFKFGSAYDLLPANGFNGFHTTTIFGNGDPKYDDIKKVVQSLGLNKNRTKEIYDFIEEKCRTIKIV